MEKNHHALDTGGEGRDVKIGSELSLERFQAQRCSIQMGNPGFTLPEMKRADSMLAEVFQKAGAEDHYRGSFYPGPHKFDLEMQSESFEWFDRWLKV